MAKIDLDRTAQIAFLKLTDEQKKSIEKCILKEIEGVENAGDLSMLQPTTKITKIIKYRKDEIVEPSKRDDLLRNAQGSSNGAFTVPKIVE